MTPIYQLAAFASSPFSGNPAAVCPLQNWLDDTLLQNIAAENNLSETAFFVPQKEGFHLRWFTPLTEVIFCGHATLASAHVLFHHLKYRRDTIHFATLRGAFQVRRAPDGLLAMNLPAEPRQRIAIPPELSRAVGKEPVELWQGPNYMAVYASEQDVASLAPDMALLKACLQKENLGLIVTAKGTQQDFVSRFFAPAHGIDEDPATGSAHCMLAPFWAEKLGKTSLNARQISARGGTILCDAAAGQGRVVLKGRCVDYMQGEIKL